MVDRHSSVEEPELIEDPELRALAEARNALRQFDIGMLLLDHWLDRSESGVNLKISDLLTLNRFALEDVNKLAGTFRTQPINISGSKHQPPIARQVPKLCEDFCDYINENWQKKSALHLSAYALWRINWIHPFVDGNGRTARIVSYVILCAKFGFRLPGTKTIPEQIAGNKEPYYATLEQADSAFDNGVIDVGAIENLIEASLRIQLQDAVKNKGATQEKGGIIRAVQEGELLTQEIPSRENIMLTLHIKNEENTKNFIERNPVLFGGVFSLLAAIIGFALGKIV